MALICIYCHFNNMLLGKSPCHGTPSGEKLPSISEYTMRTDVWPEAPPNGSSGDLWGGGFEADLYLMFFSICFAFFSLSRCSFSKTSKANF